MSGKRGPGRTESNRAKKLSKEWEISLSVAYKVLRESDEKPDPSLPSSGFEARKRIRASFLPQPKE